VAALGYEVMDVGTHSKEPVDYPDQAHEVARAVSAGSAWRGIIIDGAGIGSCIVANKVPVCALAWLMITLRQSMAASTTIPMC